MIKMRSSLLQKLMCKENLNSATFKRKFHKTIILNCEVEEIIPIKKISQQVAFIGDGNMARAICKGIATRGLLDYSQVSVSSPYVKNLDRWRLLGANVSTDNAEVTERADIVVLAVKPHILPDLIDNLKHRSDHIKNKLFVSILAGITLSRLEQLLAVFEGSRVIRLMPNTPMLVGEGCTAYCPGSKATVMDISIVRAILEVSGICQRVPEHMINAVNGLSGGGPAFAYLMIEALSDGGVRMGLHRDLATKFAAQTVLGAAKMVLQGEKHTGALKDAVCSAGGTTIAGIHELEKAGVRGAIMNAVKASVEKANEIGCR